MTLVIITFITLINIITGKKGKLNNLKQTSLVCRNEFLVGTMSSALTLMEPRREKTGLQDFRPDPTQTDLYSHRNGLEA